MVSANASSGGLPHGIGAAFDGRTSTAGGDDPVGPPVPGGLAP